jgi:hypothetical protein
MTLLYPKISLGSDFIQRRSGYNPLYFKRRATREPEKQYEGETTFTVTILEPASRIHPVLRNSVTLLTSKYERNDIYIWT